METILIITLLGVAVAARLWAAVEISRLRDQDPSFAKLMQRARAVS